LPAKAIDGKALSKQVLEKAQKLAGLLKQKRIIPNLSVILLGNDPASELYVEKKKQACESLGLNFHLYEKKINVSEKEILLLITQLNFQSHVHGILVQLPLPEGISQNKVLNAITPVKDVDGFTAFNTGLLAHSQEGMVSCTAKGIVKLVESTGVKIPGSNVCIINHSIVVGRPLAQLFLNRNATVTVCHAHTKDLASFTKAADILVTAVGKPGLVTAEMVKPGAVVIDAGIAKKGGATVGDVDFEAVKEVAGFITPVPGGVGPMTVACLIENLVTAAAMQSK
jgi:methylenetetrahydrofolate dehydrogenase (NADP+)/methenyltetrahydrofolate cyclohydrolase